LQQDERGGCHILDRHIAVLLKASDINLFFDQDAFTVVRDTLRALPLPYRLDVDAVLYTSPQAMVGSK